jgi:hypothetical protein
MKYSDALVGPLLQEFFIKHLLTHRNVSPQTLSSYSNAFRLLLQFIATKMNIQPVALKLDHLSPAVILAFLDSLEMKRHNTVRSRNARLAAIHPFILPLGYHIQARLCRTFHFRAGHPDQTHWSSFDLRVVATRNSSDSWCTRPLDVERPT